MDKVKNVWQAFKARFNALPSTLKVIIYSGGSVFLGQIITDLSQIPDWWSVYVTIFATMGSNVLAYLILREKESGSQG
jgi:hypothetical protein